MKEIIYYGFDDVPIQVEGFEGYKFYYSDWRYIGPFFDCIKATKSKDVNKWIQYLYKVGLHRSGKDFPQEYIFIGVWNTGMGNYKI